MYVEIGIMNHQTSFPNLSAAPQLRDLLDLFAPLLRSLDLFAPLVLSAPPLRSRRCTSGLHLCCGAVSLIGKSNFRTIIQMIVHPKIEKEDWLSEVEKRAILELCERVGAKRVLVSDSKETLSVAEARRMLD